MVFPSRAWEQSKWESADLTVHWDFHGLVTFIQWFNHKTNFFFQLLFLNWPSHLYWFTPLDLLMWLINSMNFQSISNVDHTTCSVLFPKWLPIWALGLTGSWQNSCITNSSRVTDQGWCFIGLGYHWPERTLVRLPDYIDCITSTVIRVLIPVPRPQCMCLIHYLQKKILFNNFSLN